MSNLPTLLFDAGRPNGKMERHHLVPFSYTPSFRLSSGINLKATEQGGDTDVVVSNESRLLRPQMAKAG